MANMKWIFETLFGSCFQYNDTCLMIYNKYPLRPLGSIHMVVPVTNV